MTNWNKEKEKKGKDNFWMGFLPSFILPIITLVFIFKMKYITQRPLFEAMFDFIQKRPEIFRSDVISSTIPCFLLLFIFNIVIKKEKASLGVFVGMVPFIILTFWMF